MGKKVRLRWSGSKQAEREHQRAVAKRKRRPKRQRFKSYYQYIQSKTWKNVRKSAFEYHGSKCQRCGREHEKMQVHHLTYERLYREKMKDLEVLCSDCHKDEHEIPDALMREYLEIVG